MRILLVIAVRLQGDDLHMSRQRAQRLLQKQLQARTNPKYDIRALQLDPVGRVQLVVVRRQSWIQQARSEERRVGKGRRVHCRWKGVKKTSERISVRASEIV